MLRLERFSDTAVHVGAWGWDHGDIVPRALRRLPTTVARNVTATTENTVERIERDPWTGDINAGFNNCRACPARRLNRVTILLALIVGRDGYTGWRLVERVKCDAYTDWYHSRMQRRDKLTSLLALIDERVEYDAHTCRRRYLR